MVASEQTVPNNLIATEVLEDRHHVIGICRRAQITKAARDILMSLDQLPAPIVAVAPLTLFGISYPVAVQSPFCVA